METHPSAETGTSQCDVILAELKRVPGAWVSLPDLAKASGSHAVHSRIADLRARGEDIEHRNQHVGRMIHSFYRLKVSGQLPLL